MWNYTNFENQKQHLLNANLSPGLFYGGRFGGDELAWLIIVGDIVSDVDIVWQCVAVEVFLNYSYMEFWCVFVDDFG